MWEILVGFYFGSTSKKKKERKKKTLETTKCGLRLEAAEIFFRAPGVPVPVSRLSSWRGPSLRPTPIPHSGGASDILIFWVQETMFLEEPPAMVRTQTPCNSPRGEERREQMYICVYTRTYIYLQPYTHIHTTHITQAHTHRGTQNIQCWQNGPERTNDCEDGARLGNVCPVVHGVAMSQRWLHGS